MHGGWVWSNGSSAVSGSPSRAMAGAARARWRRRSRRASASRAGLKLTRPDCRTVAGDGAGSRVLPLSARSANVAGGGTAPSRRPPADHDRRAYHLPSLAGGAVETEALREITENRSYLQSLTQREVAHFAYPFGSMLACAEREAPWSLRRLSDRRDRPARVRVPWACSGAVRAAARGRAVARRRGEPRVQEHRGAPFLRDLKLGRPPRAPMATMAAP